MQFVADVFWDRVVPLAVARASQAVLHPQQWGAVELVAIGGVVQAGLEFYRHGVPAAFASWPQLPARGKPLDVLAGKDRLFIAFSQVLIVVMSFHYFQFMASSENVLWSLDRATLANSLLPLPLFFIVYDAFYAPFHRALHHGSVYGYVHKHHHRQIVPTRGNTDAINVHPFEFLGGERQSTGATRRALTPRPGPSGLSARPCTAAHHRRLATLRVPQASTATCWPSSSSRGT